MSTNLLKFQDAIMRQDVLGTLLALETMTVVEMGTYSMLLSGSTPLGQAIKFGLDPVVNALLERGVDVNALSMFDSTVLQDSIRNYHINIIEKLIVAGANVNINTGTIFRPLQIAAQVNKTDVVKLLLEHGAEVDGVNPASHIVWTPLHYAANKGNIELVKILINAGADVNAFTEDGETPIDLAEDAGNNQTVEVLQQLGGLPGSHF